MMAENKESEPPSLEESKPEEGSQEPSSSDTGEKIVEKEMKEEDQKQEPETPTAPTPEEDPKMEPKEEPKAEPTLEPKVEPTVEPKEEPKAEAKEEQKTEEEPNVEEVEEQPEAEPMEVTESESQAADVQETVKTSSEETATTEPPTEGTDEGATEQEQEQEQPMEEEEVVMMDMENKENISDNVTLSDADSQDKGDTEDSADTVSEEQCYCGGGRTYEDVELQCSQCMKWFHKACINTVNVNNTVPFMTTYTFTCKKCNTSKVESFSRKVANFRELCYCSLANLLAKNKTLDPPKTLFSKEGDLIPFIDTNWEQLTPMPRRTTVTWHATIVKAMMKDDDLFVSKEKPDDPSEAETDYPLFGLIDQDLSKISPYSEGAKQGSNLRLDSSQKLGSSLNSSVNGNSGLSSSSSRISRSAKRKGIENTQGLTSSKRTRGEVSAFQKLPPHGYPLEHPFNKDGYRYILTEPDPHAPSSAFEEDQWIGKPIPAHLYRMAIGKDVLLALHDRAPQLKITEDRLSVTGHRGYCTIRASHGISRGSWYFEITVDQLPDDSATRLGWSQPLGNLQAPLGYDKFSYSWRSRKGTRFHESRGKHYSEGYGEGDTLGFFIQLPEKSESDALVPPTYKDRALIKFKSHLYFEEKDQPTEAEKALVPTTGTKIVFYKNGESQGTAYEDVYEGSYHPAVSLYKQSTVRINFGPDFKYPPKDQPNYRPVSDLGYLTAVEQTLSDILFLVEHEKDYELAARGVLIDI